jgi:hypothetical protein
MWTVSEQGRWLGQVLRGCFTYHAVPTNAADHVFHHPMERHRQRAFARRSRKAAVPWRRMGLIVAR